MGTTADLMKSTGEIRVHVVRNEAEELLVTLELVQAQASGDGPELTCVRLDPNEAERLGTLLMQAGESVSTQAE